MAVNEEEDNLEKKEEETNTRAVWELRERGTEKVPEDSRSVVGEWELDSWLTYIHTHSHTRVHTGKCVHACDKMQMLMYTHPHTLVYSTCIHTS